MRNYNKLLLGLGLLTLLPLQSFALCVNSDGVADIGTVTKDECEMQIGMGMDYTWIPDTYINIPMSKIATYNPAMIEYKSKIYYKGKDSTGDEKFWQTDGTAEGTKLVKDISPTNFIEFNDKLYLSGSGSFYGSDGTAEGTNKILTMFVSNFIKYDNKLYFQGNNSSEYGYELYSSDGTSSGTKIVKDINSNGSDGYPSYLKVFDDKLYFNANDGTNGAELWVSDGSDSGTVMVKDIYPGTYYKSGKPKYLTVFDNKLYFSAIDGTNGVELWVSDGSDTGTAMVRDIYTGNNYKSSNPKYLTVFENKLYFSADDGTNGTELWVSDGSTSKTVMFKDINPSGSSSPSYLTKFNSKLYFQAYDADGFGIWVSDGTEEGTMKVINLNKEINSIYAGSNYLYYVTSDGYIYQTDGTSKNTRNMYKEDVTDLISTPFTNITFSQEDAENISVTLTLSDDSKGSLSTTSIVSTDIASAQMALHAITYNSNGASYTQKVTITVTYGKYSTSYDHFIVVTQNNPTSSNVSFTIDEDSDKVFSSDDFIFNGVKDEDSLQAIIISTLESTGSLKLNANDVTLNQSIPVDEIKNLIYTSIANGNGTPYTTFGFKVNDGDTNSIEYTATINVTEIDDASELDTLSNLSNIENSETISVTLNASDEEGDTIGYTVASLDTTKATVAIVDGKVIVTPLKNATGSVTIEVNAISNGKVTTKTFTVDFIDAPVTKPTNLVANKWNIISLPKGKVLDTTTIDSSSITSEKAVKVYRNGAWVENPTDVNAKEAIWIHPTSTTVDITPSDDTSNDFADKTAQLTYYKSLSIDTWHFVGVQYTMEWSDLTKTVITPDSCDGYTFIKYYDSANDSWNTTTNIPTGSGIWLRHLCQ